MGSTPLPDPRCDTTARIVPGLSGWLGGQALRRLQSHPLWHGDGHGNLHELWVPPSHDVAATLEELLPADPAVLRREGRGLVTTGLQGDTRAGGLEGARESVVGVEEGEVGLADNRLLHVNEMIDHVGDLVLGGAGL